MEYWRKTKTIVLANCQGYQWMAGLGLTVLLLEVLIVVLRGDLPTLLAFLIVDSSGTLVGLWIVKTGRLKTKSSELQSCRSSLREEGMRPHFFLENNESGSKGTDICQNHEVDRTYGDRRTPTIIDLEKEEAKRPKDDTKALELLRQAGFTTTEGDQLCLLRRRYMKQEKEQTSADLNRLKFVRWLVATGKLTDQL